MKPSELLETASTGEAPFDEAKFSLVLGGPLYQLYLRTRAARPNLELAGRRTIVVTAICWLPLLLLTWCTGCLFGGPSVPFLFDAEVQAKILGAVPLLIASELIVHRRISKIIGQLFARRIIAPEDRGKFQLLVASSERLRNSTTAEVCMLLLATVGGHWLWSHDLTMNVTSWYGSRVDGQTDLAGAGYWYAFVSLPIFRFILLRWYFRLFIWYRFLWGVRALPLHLNLFHPDRAAGLGFLSGSLFAFAPFLIAQTVALAGIIGNRIWNSEATLAGFKTEIACAVLFLLFIVLTPLSFFAISLIPARRTAHREFGTLASRYVDDFRRKWTHCDNENRRLELLGTSDIQSLADLGNSYNMVNEMRVFPFDTRVVLRLAILVLAPLGPLALTIVPIDHVVKGLIKLLL
jgi:hypothetical protein